MDKEEKQELTVKVLGLTGNLLDTVLRILLLIAIAYVIYQGALKCYDLGYRIFTEEAVSATSGREVEITIPVDFSAKELGELFANNGLTRDATLFMLQYYCSEYRENVRGGTYTLSTTMTAEEMFEAIAEINIEKDELAAEIAAQEAEEAAARAAADEAAAEEAESTEDGESETGVQQIDMGDDSLLEDDLR